MKKIRYFFEYKCSPIWIYDDDMGADNIDIAVLPINTYLKEEIIELDRLYQETYNNEYPAEPLHNDKIRDYIFIRRTIESAKLLKKELEGEFIFFIIQQIWNVYLRNAKNQKKRFFKFFFVLRSLTYQI